VVLSVILAAVLAGANAYLGLFAGMTVSASIPAAVVSMAVLRLFRESNILENNIVQTAASSGEALAAGVIFTIPALMLIGHWTAFDYWQTTLISAVGGLLGVLFTIPLRRVLIVNARLRFPEGVATAEVLKVGSGTGAAHAEAAAGFTTLLAAAVLGGAVKLGESGMRLWAEALEGAVRAGRTVLYGGINLSPALLAVGFIIGPGTALVVFLGGALGWLILLPVSGMVQGTPEGLDALAATTTIGRAHPLHRHRRHAGGRPLDAGPASRALAGRPGPVACRLPRNAVFRSACVRRGCADGARRACAVDRSAVPAGAGADGADLSVGRP
jgi:putative OPT family oligopeptide transporter